MPPHFLGRDVVSIDHFTNDEIMYLLTKAADFKKDRPRNGGRNEMRGLLKNAVMGFGFFEPSTRTRLSFIRASQRQSMERLGFGSSESTSLKKNESTHHTMQMLREYEADVLVMRHDCDGAAQYLADIMDVPVINAGDGRHEHPTQAFLDLFTIYETQGRLHNLTVALVGDLKYGRTVHSLIKALRRFSDNQILLVSDDLLQISSEYTTRTVGTRSVSLRDCHRCGLDEAIAKADVLYMTRVQKERIPDESERRRVLGATQLRGNMMRRYKPNLKVLHPLPVDADYPEIEKSFYRTHAKEAYFFQQAGNGVPVREALLCAVLGKIGQDFEGKPYVPPTVCATNTHLELEFTDRTRSKNGERLIYAINNGVVIDHLPWGHALDLVSRIGVNPSKTQYLIGGGLVSHKKSRGHKDIIKLVDRELSDEELARLAAYCPGATVSVIKNHRVKQKYRLQLPDLVVGVHACGNDRCISNNTREDAPAKFYTVDRVAKRLRCHYCDTLHCFDKGGLRVVGC